MITLKTVNVDFLALQDKTIICPSRAKAMSTRPYDVYDVLSQHVQN